ncbi:MAG TPA: GNAT family N-acetyltransferase, partial [Anaerolineales bacterium]|nr:GNAT family N-acetyltransferase [Anaerolineales bacterium]
FTLEDEPISEPALIEDYEAHKDRIFSLKVAEDELGELLGFNWGTHTRFNETEAYIFIIVKPQHRRQGVGRMLFQDLERSAKSAGIQRLDANIRDNRPECLSFVLACGFKERTHSLGMELDLSSFDDRLYDETLARLKSEGFQFTSMDKLGNTEEAQRKLYALNDMTGLETPGAEGVQSWLDFEDFQKKVCQSSWYKPAGQMVVIDTITGEWAAMSAITRFEGAEYAYNLHTGVDKRYRNRKLAQAVKTLALRFARQELGVTIVRTNNNSLNQPMKAINRKFGYLPAQGSYLMEKILLL